MALEKELETYRRHMETGQLISHEGKFVLIKGDCVVDFLETFEDALKEGYEKFKLDPFLVKRISASEQIQYFTQDILGVCHQ